MSSEEKTAWIGLVLAIGTYAVYAGIILSQGLATPLADVPYISTLLWTIGVSIVGSIIVQIAVSIVTRDTGKKDRRDKEIYRFGEYFGRWFLIVAALGAMVMAMAEWPYFWIANVIYLGFVLSTVLASVLKIVAYRRGIQSW
ncbi:MAG: hypothetical protein JWR36_317 [Glaciihabitans sp.]|nr:hypothetical protein [Glaciihabitans sp.]MDQ1570352.1 hypothetical protein [Actinomycetota bacterium]